MGRRRLFLCICAGWLALALLRLGTNVANGVLATVGWLRLIPAVTGASLFWIPAAGLALWINRARFARRKSRLVLAHVTLALILSVIEPAWVLVVRALMGLPTTYFVVLISRLDSNILLYAIVVVADVAWTRWVTLKAKEVAAARLEQTLTDIQLHALAIQLQPHFLFNALQFVAETAHDNLAEARRTLGLLRGLVQQAFALETRVQVSVAEEISFLQAYGEIQKSRFGDRFELTTCVEDAALGAAVPPLLLQPLVENASRHGFARRASGGRVEVRVLRRNNVLSIVVADDGDGLPARVKEGQGLSVTRRRLARLYGADAHLTLTRGPDGRTEARLRLPYRDAAAVPLVFETDSTSPDALVAMAGAGVAHTGIGDAGTADDGVPSTGSFEVLAARVPFAARIAAVWLFLMMLVIGATYAGVRMHVYWPDAVPGLESFFLEEIVGAPFWVALTGIALVAARRLSGKWALPIHATIALGIAITHALVAPSLAQAMFHKPPMEMAFVMWAPWDVLVYAALVLLARSHELGGWVRAKMREEVTLNAEVVRATTRLKRLRETQSVLLSELDDVIASPTMETLDRAVVGFADFLRVDVMAGAME